MDEARVLRDLADDGLELLGEIQLGGAMVVGDPSLLDRTPAYGSYHAAATTPGRWLLLGRADAADPDALSEVVVCHEDVLGSFWDHYDEAEPVTAVPTSTGRVLVAEAMAKDDAALRMSAYEPDPDGLPWVRDRAVVLAADPTHAARVFQPPVERLWLFSVTFGPEPSTRVGRPLGD